MGAQVERAEPGTPPPEDESPIADLSTHAQPNVSPRQLAEYWGTTLVTIHRWIRKGALRAFKVGPNWRVKTKDAREFEKWSE